jgi:cytochrome b involved in lipid metabolism
LGLTLPTIKSTPLYAVGNNSEGGPKVYDVTNYLDDHPGGAEVMLDLAGKDADEFFEDIGHSNDARAELKKHLIGVLKLDEAEMARLKEQAEAAAKKKAESSSNMLIFVLILLLAIGIAYYKKNMS